jgi:HAD superfamily hydrolase (TIGR01509 family)
MARWQGRCDERDALLHGIATVMVRALLWDHDGVLVDTEGLYFQATRETLAGVGVVLSESVYRQLFLIEGRGAWHLARERGATETQVAQLKAARDARYTELVTRGDVLIPGVMPLLRGLGRQFRMAIVTSSQRAHFDAIHRDTGLPALFELVLTCDDYGASKPDPEPYVCAVDRLGVAGADCLVIEDSRRGLLAAHAAGLRCWVIPSTLTAASSFAEAEVRLARGARRGAARAGR